MRPSRLRDTRAFTLIELLVALALLLAALALIANYLSFSRPNPVPTAFVSTWTGAPTVVTVNTPTTFTYHMDKVTPLTGSGMSPADNVDVQFVTGPGITIKIVSLNGTPVNSDNGHIVTDAQGNVSIVIQSATVVPQGALVAVPVGSTVTTTTRFEVQ